MTTTWLREQTDQVVEEANDERVCGSQWFLHVPK